MNNDLFDLYNDLLFNVTSADIPVGVNLALRSANPDDFYFDENVDPDGYFLVFADLLDKLYEYSDFNEYVYRVTNEYFYDIVSDSGTRSETELYTVISKPLVLCNAETGAFFFLDGVMECSFDGNYYTSYSDYLPPMALLKFMPPENTNDIYVPAKLIDFEFDFENNQITTRFEYPTMFFFIVILDIVDMREIDIYI